MLRFAFPRPFSAAAVACFLSIVGCSDEAALDPETLFGDQRAPSPNRLRGVYKTVVEEPGVDVEIRLRFGEGFLAGAVMCTPTSKNYPPVSTDGKVEMETGSIDNAAGQFTIPTLTMEKTVDPILCQAAIRGATYDFKLEELKLTLTLPGTQVELVYTKIGD